MAIFWTFLGPALCMWFFGYLTPSASGLAPVTVVQRTANSAVAAKLVSALRRDGHFVTEADQPTKDGLWIEVLPGTDGSTLSQVILHAGTTETEADRSLHYEVESELMNGPSRLKISMKHSASSTSGFQRTVPAYLIMFLTMNLLMSGAGFAEERASGRMRRLLSAPVGAFQIVAGRLMSRLLVAWVQMLVLFSIGVFVLHIHWTDHPLSVVAMLSFYVLAMGSIGILVGSCLRDPDQAFGLAMWGALVLAPLTGLWWPVELMPGALQTLAHWIPTGWVMQSVNSMLETSSGLGQFPLPVAGLLAVAAVAIWISSKRLATNGMYTGE